MGVRMIKDGVEIDANEDIVPHYERMGWSRKDPTHKTASERAQERELEELAEQIKPVPSIAEMRTWAIENGVPNVPERGKLPKHAIDAYRAAHEG